MPYTTFMDTITEEIYALEQALLQPEVRRSAARLNDLLAEGFREIGSSGRVYTRDDILEMLPAETGAVFTLSGFETVQLSPDVVLATYAVSKTVDARIIRSLRSSIWQRVDGRWRMLFHQGTTTQG
jgi:hypothetical protein